jgi:hypothetical protein
MTPAGGKPRHSLRARHGMTTHGKHGDDGSVNRSVPGEGKSLTKPDSREEAGTFSKATNKGRMDDEDWRN